MKNAIYKYLVYVIYFLGIGMISSGIVLMPFNRIRYGVVLIIGLSLFLAGSLFNEFIIDKHSLSKSESIKLVFWSLMLALGIGMISGGISHYKESPVYVSYLIPIGIFLSFISFFVKNHYDIFEQNKVKLVTGILLMSFVVYIALNMTIVNMEIPVGGDIFKDSMNGHSMW